MLTRGLVLLAALVLLAGAAVPAQTNYLPISDVRPGMVGIGRTVFEGDRLEEFKVQVLGVLHNEIGPRRDLILARLEGGPLARTGVIAGMSGRFLAGRNYPHRVLTAVVLAIVAAMPLVAAGITFSPWIGFVGALLLTTGVVLLAVLTVGWVRPAINSVAWRILLLIGAIASCVALVLACLYAYSLATHTLILTIPTMALTHGLLNAFGFVTCSLVAWSQIAPRKLEQ